MRKRLIKLTAVLLVGGGSSIALAMPASAATLTATSITAVSAFQSPLARLAETSTGTSTGTGTALASVLTMSFGTPVFTAFG